MTLTLLSKKGFWEIPGVSRTLNVTYLDKVSDGQEVEIEAEAVKMGKRLGKFCCAPNPIKEGGLRKVVKSNLLMSSAW